MHRPSDANEWTFPLQLREQDLPLRVRLPRRLGDDALYDLCQRNGDLRIEQAADGELIIMSPTGGETSRRNAALVTALSVWAAKDGTGVVFDSNGGFRLPNGAERAPDVAWVTRERWNALTREEREKFPPLCPDFVVELRSPSDSLDDLHAKMREYMANGARLGWLLDPTSRRAWLYEGAREPACVEDATTVSGEPVLRGFVLDLAAIG